MEADWYRILGVPVSASDRQVRDAYRTLVWRLHPDHSRPATEAERQLAARRMHEVNEAWTVLGDRTRRADYDRQRLGGLGHDELSSNGRNTSRVSAERPTARRFRTIAEEQWADRWGLDEADIADLMVDEAFNGELGLAARGQPASTASWVANYGVFAVIIGVLLAIVLFTGISGAKFASNSDDADLAAAGCALGITLVDCEDPHDSVIMGLPDASGACPDGQRILRLARNTCVVDAK